MNEITVQIVSVVAILGFLWGLRRDMANLRKDVSEETAGMRKDVIDLRERMARIEGLLEGLVAHPREAKV